VVDRNFRAAGRSSCATNEDITLGDGVNLAVSALQLRHQQRTAAQAFGVAHRRNRHVNRLARLGIGRKVGRNHHGGDILELQLLRLFLRQIHPHLRQHVADGLGGERGLRGLVAGIVEADDDAIADQLVAAYALNAGQILDALGENRLAPQRQDASGQNCRLPEQFAAFRLHDAPPREFP
jgi:hypothetical protein